MHHYRNTTATGTSLQRSRTHVTFSNVHLAMPGGHAPMSTGVPTDNGDYNPNSIGTRPAFGFYLHNVTGIHFMNSSFEFSKNDGRPAILANTGGNVSV
ncbi:MAG: hypothetical protein JO345_39240, partial [Streptosporangiaceae bacterium]|nr:hypothetical protein [Streptosporangiaceae bacterium]